MKVLLLVLSLTNVILMASAAASIEKVDIKILDTSKGKCVVTIHPGPPKGVDVDIESFVEAKDITLSFAAFSLIDGNYNPFLEPESISICDMPKSDNPLIAFVYKEITKAGNIHEACPIKKMKYFIHGLRIDDKDVPVALPAGSFKIELNGTLHEHDKDVPMFISDLYFKET